MPKLTWVGRDKVVNHHHEVPFRILKKMYSFASQPASQPAKCTSTNNPINNRIIHGDNLEALKSLLPEFEGKINCIYIDPPYNTGTEEWIYNDNVNDPKIRKWLGKVVGKEGEDLSRHDKWLCMMYPRIKLLHKLLSHDGVIFISIDRFEFSSMKTVLDEIFGISNWVGEIAWKNVTDNNPTTICLEHEYILCYAKDKKNIPSEWKSDLHDAKEALIKIGNEITEKFATKTEMQSAYTAWFKENKAFLGALDRYKFIDEGGVYTGSQSVHNPGKEGYRYDVIHPVTQKPCKQPLMGYRFPFETMQSLLAKGQILFGVDEKKLIELKLYAKDYKQKLSSLIEMDGRVGTNELKSIFVESSRPFPYPKPSALIEELLSYTTKPNDIVLDSFAGSGTTAHAILKLNQIDGGTRKFILIETMNYAEDLTAERVRRVMNGYGENDKAVAGTGGSFDFYTVDAPLFNEDKNLNEEVGEAIIRDYVAYSERIPEPARSVNKDGYDANHIAHKINPHSLGVTNTALWIFYYDRNRITTLDLDFLGTLNIKVLLNEGKSRPELFVIYADKCALPKDFLYQHGITFKRIPRDITRF